MTPGFTPPHFLPSAQATCEPCLHANLVPACLSVCHGAHPSVPTGGCLLGKGGGLQPLLLVPRTTASHVCVHTALDITVWTFMRQPHNSIALAMLRVAWSAWWLSLTRLEGWAAQARTNGQPPAPSWLCAHTLACDTAASLWLMLPAARLARVASWLRCPRKQRPGPNALRCPVCCSLHPMQVPL